MEIAMGGESILAMGLCLCLQASCCPCSRRACQSCAATCRVPGFSCPTCCTMSSLQAPQKAAQVRLAHTLYSSLDNP